LRYRRRRIGVFRTLRKTNRRQGDPIMSNHKQAETDLLREIENGISTAFAEMFSSKPIKIPGPDHPITITPTKGQITVVVAGKRVADTREALTLKEAAYPAVQYIPRKDIDQTQLQRTSHQTYCPYKGECAYYSIPAGGERSVNAVWSYEAPYVAVSAIREYLAFYPDRVDAIEVGVGD
jgi:uncharacterized protein (DUF427 family)